MKKTIRLHVQTIKGWRSVTYLIEQTNTGLHEHLKFMNVRTVRVVRYAPYVQKRKMEITEKFITTKNGNNKKNLLENSFQKQKLAKFTANVKLM